MTKMIYTIDEFNTGQSQDEFYSIQGGINDCMNVDLDTNLKSVRLPTAVVLHGTVVGHPHDIDDAMKGAAASPLVLTDNNGAGYIYSGDEPFYRNAGSNGNFRKLLKYGTYNLILTKTKIHYWTDTGGGSSSYASLIGSNLAPAMDSANFTTGAGWAWNSSTVTHTAGGGTNTLLPNPALTIVASTYYRVFISHTCTAGSCAVTLGGVSVGTLDTTNQSGVYLRVTTSTTGNLIFAPTSSYDGSITNITVQRSYVTEGTRTFPAGSNYKPYFVNNANNLLIGDGRYVVQLAWAGGSSYLPASGTFTGTDILLTLPNDETIYGIFGLGDQIVIFTNKKQYFWDGINSYVDRIVNRDEPIIGVSQHKNEFFVITGNSFSSYALWRTSDGYNRQLIFRDETYVSHYFQRNRLIANIDENYGNFMVDKGRFWWGGELTAPEDGIFHTFGSKKAGYPEHLKKGYTGFGIVSLVKQQTHYTYIGCYSVSTGKIYQIDDRKGIGYYEDSKGGWFTTEKIFGTKQGTEKTAEKILLGYRADMYNTTFKPLTFLSYKADNERTNFTFLIDGGSNPVTTAPTAGAVYTVSSNTFTVVDVQTLTYDTNRNYYLISMTLTTGTNRPAAAGTLTKSSGTGDSSLTYVKYNDYKLIGGTVDSTKFRQMFLFPAQFNEIEIRCDMFTSDENASPVIYDFTFTYDEVKDDTT